MEADSNTKRATRPMWTSPEYEKAIADATTAKAAAEAEAAQRSKPSKFQWPSSGLSARIVAWTLAALIGLAIGGWITAEAFSRAKNIPPRDPAGMEQALGLDDEPIQHLSTTNKQDGRATERR